jgi:predicted outer membrane lipoprotein
MCRNGSKTIGSGFLRSKDRSCSEMADFREKVLEDYTCKYPDKLLKALQYWYSEGSKAWLLGKQIATTFGVIDALMVIDTDLFVVEFKAVQATQKDVGQLQRYRSAIRQCNPYRVLNGDALYALDLVRAVEKLHDVKLMLVAPSFTKQALLGADACIEATHANGTFTYKAISYLDDVTEASADLQAIVNPYLKYLVERQIALMKHREKYTLKESARKTASNTN